MKDFRTELADLRCWDKDVQKFFEENGQPIVDCALQNREEVIALCEWIAEHRIQSYLEIGIWTGRLVNALHRIFTFQTSAACDIGGARFFDLETELHPRIMYFQGNSRSPIYENWRKKLGRIDLTFIDTDHSYEGIKRDFEINTSFPHRYIALAGIAGDERFGAGVKQFWDELEGNKLEIIRPHAEIDQETSSFGIGIWSA